MRIESERDIEGLRAVGRAVARTLLTMRDAAEAGVSTRALDELGARCLADFGARSAPQTVYDFPGATCISINEEAAHGIPGDRVISPGDVVNIDVSAEMDGYFGDTGATFIVPPSNPLKNRLRDAAEAALAAAMAEARAGQLLNRIGRAIEKTADAEGFTTLRDLGSHGVGRSLHGTPRFIPNYFDPADRRRLADGMVITIEPFVSTRAVGCSTARDGWTLVSGRGNLSAQFEHTMVIRKGEPLVMTLP